MPYYVPRTTDPETRLTSHGWDEVASGCWRARGNPNSSGYRMIKFNGKAEGAHRLAYMAWVGAIPEGHVVRHNCDNRMCVNPDHLTLGSHKENSRDMVTRGRSCRGEKHWNAVLSDEDVEDIRTEYAKGVLTQDMLAEAYGVSRAAITKRLRKDK